MNKRNIFRVLGLSVILWGTGMIAVNSRSVASCVPETGLTSLLHKAFFMQNPGCALSAPKSCAQVGSTCFVPSSFSPGNTVAGKCAQTFAGCVCVPNKAQ